MHDSSKRNTLKLLGGSTAGVAIPTSFAMAETATRPNTASPFPAATKRNPELLIQLIHSLAVPDDSIVLQNQTNEKLVISRFMPSTVIFDDVQCDLNEAAGRELTLAPGQVISLRTQMMAVDSDSIGEYVWANGAVQPSLNYSDVSIVFMGAFMADKQAIVFPQDTPSAQTSFPA
jgi:hypothetical protein